MKKTIILLALLLVIALVFAGCKKEESGLAEASFILDNGEDVVTVTADSATQGSGGVGYLDFEEGEMLHYNLSGSDSKEQLKVTVFFKEEPENPMSYAQPEDSENVYMYFSVQNGTSGNLEMDPGEYALLIEVESASFSGTATFDISVE